MIGKTISHYKIIEKLGGGGMGIVYKAVDTKLKRTVALKFLPPDLTRDPEAKERFIQEAQAASALDHPNICTIHEIDETKPAPAEAGDGKTFIVMACYEGEILKDKIQRGPLKLEEAIDIAIQIAQGLEKAHKKGIVHRDIKPANIFITDDGIVKIMDFGLAKLTGRTKLTKVGTTMGTVAYMSPEQSQGKEVDHRTDIWSLGVVLYEMLSGQSPFKGEYEQAVIYSILNEDPEPFLKLSCDVSPELETIVNKCLQKIPDERYQTVSELRTDITLVIAGKDPRLAAIHRRMAPGRLIRMGSYRRSASILALVILVIFLLWLIPSNWRAVKNRLGFRAIPDRKHLVVLPFTHLGEDPMNKAFSDGLMESLTHKLIQLEQFQGSLWVVPASDVRHKQIATARDAFLAFGVNLAVAGELQRSSDSFRLTLTLIDTKTLKELGLAVIENRMANVSLLQDESVFKITKMLDIKLSPESRRILTTGGTTVSSAYNFYLLGHGYLQQFEKIVNLVTAISFFNRVIEQDSLYALAHASLGKAYWRRYEASKDSQWVKEALSNCERAVELNDLLASTHETLGHIYIESGRYEEGMKELQRTLELNPFSTATYDRLAKAYEAQGRIETAESTYQKAIQKKPDYWAGYKYLGLFYFRNGRYDDAVKQFHQVLMLTPDDYIAYNNLGGMYYYVERYEDARQMFERSITIEPSWEAVSNLGTLYRLEGRYAESARVYEGALDFYNDDYQLWGNLASAYYWAPGERQKAFDTYQRAINMAEEQRRLTPQQPDLLSDLAGYYSMTGDHTKTILLVEQALAIAPKNVEVMYRAGHAYEQLGERKKAVEWIEKALENGFSLVEIESDPGLHQLCADPRFQQIVQNQRIDK